MQQPLIAQRYTPPVLFEFARGVVKVYPPWQPMGPTCLFVINGLGLGNSTRCHAVIEHLAQAGSRIHILTSGNGLTYFEDKDGVESLSSMESFFYSGKNGGVSGWSTLKSIRRLLAIARAKRRQLASVLDQIVPDVAIVDSEYAITPLRRRGIPLIGLNTSEMVVSQFLRRRHAPEGVRSHFWLVEFTDYLFHRHFCDVILSPFPLRTPTRHPKFKRIGLIIRHAIREQALRGPQVNFVPPRSLRNVLFMLSGSVHASNIPFERYQFDFHIDVVGRSGQSTTRVTYHGRKLDNAELLAQSDALVINGGYSAVSEAFALRKPVFVVPVPGHAEQFVNASLVRDLGLGMIATETDVLHQLLERQQQNQWLGWKPMPATFEINGAQEAANAILALTRRPASLPTVAPAWGQI